MSSKTKKAKPTAGVPVKFPAEVKDARKLDDEKLKAKLADHLSAIDQANRLDPHEVIRTGVQERVLSGMRQSAEQVEALRAEVARRRRDNVEVAHRSFWSRGQGSPKEQKAKWEAEEAEQERTKAERTAELNAIRQEETRQRRAEQVKAGVIYEPLGGWAFDGSDALAALFASPFVWECLDKRGEGPVLTVHDLGLLHTCLGLIAENGGEEVRVRVDRFPRLPEEWRGDRGKMLEHLRLNGLIEVERQGVNATIRRGPRVEQLRESYRQQTLERARQAGA